MSDHHDALLEANNAATFSANKSEFRSAFDCLSTFYNYIASGTVISDHKTKHVPKCAMQ